MANKDFKSVVRLIDNITSDDITNNIENDMPFDLTKLEVVTIQADYGEDSFTLVDKDGNSKYGSFFVIISYRQKGHWYTNKGNSGTGPSEKPTIMYWNNKTKTLYEFRAGYEGSSWEEKGTIQSNFNYTLTVGYNNSSYCYFNIFKLGE